MKSWRGSDRIIAPWLKSVRDRLHSRNRVASLLSGLLFDFFPDDGTLGADILEVFKKHRANIDYVRAYREGARFNQIELYIPSESTGVLDVCRANGAMLNVCRLQTEISYIGELASLLGSSLSCNVRIDAFCASEGLAATPIHYDYDNAFVAQVVGSKTWACHENLSDVHFHFGGYQVDKSSIGEMHFRKILSKGDGIFIPGGTLHEAFTTDDVSIHLAIDLDPVLPERVVASWLEGKLNDVAEQPESYCDFDCDAAALLRRHALDAMKSITESELVESHNRYLMWSMSGYKRIEFAPPSFADREKRFRIAPGAMFTLMPETTHFRIEYSSHSPGAVLAHAWSYRPASAKFPLALLEIIENILASPSISAVEIDEWLPPDSSNVLVSSLFKMGILYPVFDEFESEIFYDRSGKIAA